MAMFCLALVTVVFVLAGAPQPCRCDRTQPAGNDVALRATLSSDNALDGNVWSRIRERVLGGEDGNNLISSARLPHAVPPSTELMFLESLINRYRKYMVERVVRFDDACSLLFGGEDDEADEVGEPPQVAVDSRTETSHSRDRPNALVDGSVGSSFQGNGGGGESFRPEINASHQLQRDGLTMQLTRSTHNGFCSRNVKQYYQCLLDRFNDQQLIGMVRDYLESYCARPGPFDRSMAALQKRDTPRYVSKQKFHSWGGKRNTAQVFYPWGGKRTIPRAHKQPKVVIRNPFHSWGGKRSGLTDEDSFLT
ncbi:LOW QUALITY PROTEIN: leucokinins-like [Anopheles marshallii]|uniref:LOW QUALITY PROTEIN: leucokinins-like n=1 Tax=Anopheles marshallii TaxID=1521116 RepID=UPI00237A3274|nr:LOW QUALITY PROTEIN: leucokinins-like [Anopheles marshallii]